MSVINITELQQQIAQLNKKMDGLIPAGAPKPVPQSLTEPFETKKPTMFEAYKSKLVTALKDTTRAQATHNKILSEAITAADGTAAIPTIWAKDVFRCCPYPASAFYDNPFIKWHEDIHGAPGGTVMVTTVGKAACGTAGCAEPVGTPPTIAAVAISLEEYQCSFFLCRDDMEDMVEDTVTELNNSLASCLDECIDNAFIANIIGKGHTVDHGTNIIDPAWIAETIGSMRSGNQCKWNKTLYSRTYNCESVIIATCAVLENLPKQNVLTAIINLSANLSKAKQPALIVVDILFSIMRDTVHMFGIGEKTILNDINYKLKETENGCQNITIKHENYLVENATSARVQRDDLNFTKKKVEYTQVTPRIMQKIIKKILSCCVFNVTKQYIGQKTNLNSNIMNLKLKFHVLLTVSCEPVWMVMHPAVEARLMRNAQFVNAATFGDRSVITGGHIIKYLGLDIVVVPKGSLVSNAPGTYRTLMASRYAIHAVKKRDPTIETQYLVQTQRKYVYASVRFGKSVVCNDGVYWLLTAA